jgi:hypothetical protein
MATDLNKLYGELRAQILSRHFAIGRHFRADHLCFSNNLGVVHQTGTFNPDTENDVIHGCLWADVLVKQPGAEVKQPASVYASAPALLALGKHERLFERWRVGDHSRSNPLLYSGQLMVCLAVEISLGVPGSLNVLSRLLATTNSLFKFSTPPNDGYILRWDPVTSDHWTTFEGKKEEVFLDHCCDFFTDSGTAGGYLYCTPFDDPRYTPYMAQSDFKNLTPDQMTAYLEARQLSILQNRYWEPSEDELVGLLTGYSFVSRLVSDPGIQAAVADQAKRIGGYLSANAYLLVRPGGGFAAQGGSDICPALEFPFGRIFSRITGSEFSSQTNFQGALQNAGLWSQFSAGFFVAVALGIIFAPLLYALILALGGSLGGAIVGAIVAAGGTVVVGRAVVIWLNYEAFDVLAYPTGSSKDHEEQRAFWYAYLLGILPKQLRFTAWLFFTRYFGSGYALNFPPFLGLGGFGDSDTTVRNAYLHWFNARGGSTPAPGVFRPPPQTTLVTGISSTSQTITVADATEFGPPNFNVSINSETLLVTAVSGVGNATWTVSRGQNGTDAASAPAGSFVVDSGFDDAQGEFASAFNPQNIATDPFATAVAVLLGAGQATQVKLKSLLADLAGEFDASRKDELGIFEDQNPLNGETYVTEPVRPALNYMAALALAWFFSKTQADAGTPLPASLGFPNPPPAGTKLAPATIPREVIERTRPAEQVIPLSGLPPLPNPIPHEVDLFSPAAPAKPANPPLPVTSASWLVSVTQSHFGNLFGDSGTETINAGVMLPTPGCSILGVKLTLVNRHGTPLGGARTTTSLGRASQQAGVSQWPSPVAIDGYPFTASARIMSIGATPTDESIKVQWRYSSFRACRFQIAYLVQGANCSL